MCYLLASVNATRVFHYTLDAIVVDEPERFPVDVNSRTRVRANKDKVPFFAVRASREP